MEDKGAALLCREQYFQNRVFSVAIWFRTIRMFDYKNLVRPLATNFLATKYFSSH